MGKCGKQLLFGVLEMTVEQETRSTDEASSLSAVEAADIRATRHLRPLLSSPSFFRYELLARDGAARGGCCLACFPRLIRAMKHRKRDAYGHTGDAE
jgi:hypothetical protein